MGRGGEFPIHLVDGFGGPAYGAGGGRYVHRTGMADGFAHIQGIQQGQFVAVGFDQVRKANQHGFAFGRGQLTPVAALKDFPGDGYGFVRIGLVATGHLGQFAAVYRADRRKGFTVYRPAITALYIGAALYGEGVGHCLPLGLASGCSGNGIGGYRVRHGGLEGKGMASS